MDRIFKCRGMPHVFSYCERDEVRCAARPGIPDDILISTPQWPETAMSKETQQSQASEKLFFRLHDIRICGLQIPPAPDVYPNAGNNAMVLVAPSSDITYQKPYLLQSPNVATMMALMMLRDSGTACDLMTDGGNQIVSVLYPPAS